MKGILIFIYRENKNKYTYPDYAQILTFLSVTIYFYFSFTSFLKKAFLNVMLQAIYAGNSLKVVGEFVPSTRPYI